MTRIAGHTLTAAQVKSLDILRDYMIAHSGDSKWTHHTSPSGDGSWVNVYKIFPASGNTNSAHRRNLARLEAAGVLRACEIVSDGSQCYRGVPLRAQGRTE